jgi:hypothetical protein
MLFLSVSSPKDSGIWTAGAKHSDSNCRTD